MEYACLKSNFILCLTFLKHGYFISKYFKQKYSFYDEMKGIIEPISNTNKLVTNCLSHLTKNAFFIEE